jgi:hypothetical protein
MSGPRELITAGNPATDTDMQRLADAAAGADDLALEAMLEFAAPASPSVYSKLVTPLWDEYQVGDPLFVPGLLVRPATGGAQGKFVVYPLRVSVSKQNDGFAVGSVEVGFSMKQTARMFSTLVPSNALGAPRHDALYAVVQRSVSVSGSRRVKSLADGSVSTQSVNLESAPTITLVVATGTTSAFPALPADTSTAWNVALAVFDTPNGFTSGDLILQSAIHQIWSRGWIAKNRVQGIVPGSLFTSTGGTYGKPDTPIDNTTLDAAIASRWGGEVKIGVVVKQTADVGAVVLDTSIDWRFRKVAISMLVAKDHGGAHSFPGPELVTKAGSLVSLTSGPQYTGDDGLTVWSPSFDPGDGSGSRSPIFVVDAVTGALSVGLTYARIYGVTTNYYIEVTATDQFVF